MKIYDNHDRKNDLSFMLWLEKKLTQTLLRIFKKTEVVKKC